MTDEGTKTSCSKNWYLFMLKPLHAQKTHTPREDSARSKDTKARELMEAFYIRKQDSLYVSDTSVVLYKAEKKFIEHVLLYYP